MNLLERVILLASPMRAARRARARAMVQAYEAAKDTRRTKSWARAGGDANSEIGPALMRLRHRARQLVRDNPYASRAVEILTSHRVGYGITVTSNTRDPDLDARVNAVWAEWCARADASGVQSWDGMLELAARTWAEGGEALIRFVRMMPGQAKAKGLPLPLQVEILEGDMLDETRTQRLPGGGAIVQGVEMDRSGGRVAFHLYREHPGSAVTPWGVSSAATSTDRWPASEILHLFTQQRPGQQRGVPIFASVTARLARLDEYEDAALEKAKVEACLAAFVTRPGGAGGGTVPTPGEGEASNAQDLREDSVSPGMILYTEPGEDVETLVPSGAGQFEPLALHFLMSCAIGTNITYNQLTGDLRQATFSSLKAGNIDFRRGIDRDHWLRLIPMVVRPVWDAVMAAAVMMGRLEPRLGGYPAECMPPAHEMVDPTREIPAMIRLARAGGMTMPQFIAGLGYNWRSHLAEIKEWNEAVDKDGIVLDSDPRRTATSGGAQDSKQNAAVELGSKGGPRPAPPADPGDGPTD